jgi:DNA adenine methylase
VDLNLRQTLGLASSDITVSLRPPLKWAGGKRWLVPHLKPIWREHSNRRLVEPLCGGLAVTLGLMPTHALLNDINIHAINFFVWLKKGLTISISMENNRELYYQHRKRFNELIKTAKSNNKEVAGLFYYLNRTCYNGLCRFNRSGEFNVPFGSYKKINYARDFTPYKLAFRNWDFTTGDFEDVSLDPEDFVYADPPYDVEFTQYSKEGFSWEDQIRLAKWLKHHKGPVMLSNQATKRIRKLYTDLGYQLRFLNVPRMISCKGDKRIPVIEVLAFRGV